MVGVSAVLFLGNADALTKSARFAERMYVDEKKVMDEYSSVHVWQARGVAYFRRMDPASLS